MGASRKLQGEIDRVLKKVQEGVDVFDSIWNKVYDTENANQKEKFEADLKKEIKKLQRYRDQIKTWIQSSEIKDKKVSASYEQALMDARKLIEREMERFKVCEKETKTKAFSKEGLGQQPKTDPKEKAKSETRDWLNNVVGDLESQIDYFEAEVEGLSVKKGKTRPPRLVHLETSITRHKAHIMKLELILRLLDNDELSPEQVNDVKDFIEDYVERNQEDFDEFADVDDLYNSLPLDVVEALEDQLSLGPSSLVKGVASASTANTILGLKNSVSSSTQPATSPAVSQSSALDQEETSEDSNADSIPRTPPPKVGVSVSLASTPATVSASGMTTATNLPVRPVDTAPTVAAILSGSPATRVVAENSSVLSSSLANPSSSIKEEDSTTFTGRRSPAIPDVGLGRGIPRGLSNQTSIDPSGTLASSSVISVNGSLGSVSALELAKKNMLAADERIGSNSLAQPMASPSSNRVLLEQVSKPTDGTVSNDNSSNIGEAATIVGRVFSPSLVTGVQWRPQSASSFQNPNETGQLRGRAEIAPDQREKFLQRFQQVQQQGHSNLLGVPHISGASHKQFTSQQQNSLLQQFNGQSSSVSSQVGIGLGGAQRAGVSFIPSMTQQQPSPIFQQSTQHLLPSGTKDGDYVQNKVQEQVNISDDFNVEPPPLSPSLNKFVNDDDSRIQYMAGSASVAEGSQSSSAGQSLQPSQPLASLGVIGRRTFSDHGAIGDNLGGSAGSSAGIHDQLYNLQLLEAAYHKLPEAQDSKRYIPRYPAATPASYPQVPAPIIDSPRLWERFGGDAMGTDTLFFAFYYTPNTRQQYLAARELKRQSWRYHKNFSTWFQRHEEPKITNDTFERGTYVYFDFQIADDTQHGWCQRIRTDFTFEYEFLEDELVV